MMDIRELLQSDTVRHTALMLGHFLWQGTALAIIYLITCRLMQRATPAARHALGVATLLVMLACLPTTYFVLQNQPLVPRSASQLPMVPAQVITPNTAPPLIVLPEETPTNLVASTISAPVKTKRAVEAHGALKSPDPLSAPLTDRGLLDIQQSDLDIVASLTTTLYTLGLLVMCLRLVLSLVGARRLRLGSQPITDTHFLSLIEEQATRLGLKALPLVAACEHAATPVVIGIFKPVLLLPAQILTGLDEAQLRSVIAHELAHIRRLDPLVLLIQRLCETIIFFHPLMWIVSRRVSLEREQACDDLALAHSQAPLDYAQTLLHIAELTRDAALGSTQPIPQTVNAMAKSPSQLRRRINRVLGIETQSPLRLSPASVLGTLAMLGVIALALTSPLGAKQSDSVDANAKETYSGPITATIDQDTAIPTVVFSNGVKIELVAIQDERWGGYWWAPDGAALGKRAYGLTGSKPGDFTRYNGGSGERKILLRVHDPDNKIHPQSGTKGIDPYVPFSSGRSYSHGSHTQHTVGIHLADDNNPLELHIAPAFEEWVTLATFDNKQNSSGAVGGRRWGAHHVVNFHGAHDVVATGTGGGRSGWHGDVSLTLTHTAPYLVRVVAVDREGREHFSKTYEPSRGLMFKQMQVFFEGVKLADIESFKFEGTRRHHIVFENLAVNPGQFTNVKVDLNRPHDKPLSFTNSGGRFRPYRSPEPIDATVEGTGDWPVVAFENGLKIEMLGVTDSTLKGPRDWWRPSGAVYDSKADGLSVPRRETSVDVDGEARQPSRHFVMRMTGGEGLDPELQLSVPNARGSGIHEGSSDGGPIHFNHVHFREDAAAADVHGKLAMGEWRSVASNATYASMRRTGEWGQYLILFNQAIQTRAMKNGKSVDQVRITVSHTVRDGQYRVMAKGADGALHAASSTMSSGITDYVETVLVYDGLTLGDITGFSLDVRPYRDITFRNVALHSDSMTEASVEVGPDPNEGLNNPKRRSYVSDGPIDATPLTENSVPSVTLPSGVKVEVVAVRDANVVPEHWWRADGSSLAEGVAAEEKLSDLDNGYVGPYGSVERAFGLRITGPDDKKPLIQVETLNSMSKRPNRTTKLEDTRMYFGAIFNGKHATADLRVRVAVGDWQPVFRQAKEAIGTPSEEAHRTRFFDVRERAFTDSDGKSTTRVALKYEHNLFKEFTRIAALDSEGNILASRLSSHNGFGNHSSGYVDLREVKLEDIHSLELQTRAHEAAEFSGVALHEGRASEVSVDVEPAPQAKLQNTTQETPTNPLTPQPSNPAATPPANQTATITRPDGSLRIDLPEGFGVELIGLLDPEAPDVWWRPSGEVFDGVEYGLRPPADQLDTREKDGQPTIKQSRIVAYRALFGTSHPQVSVSTYRPESAEGMGATSISIRGDGLGIVYQRMQYYNLPDTLNFSARIIHPEWVTLAKSAGRHFNVQRGDGFTVVFNDPTEFPAEDRYPPNRVELVASFDSQLNSFADEQVLAIDQNGKKYLPEGGSNRLGQDEGFTSKRYTFHELTINDIDSYLFQTHPVTHATIGPVALHPNQPTDVKVEVISPSFTEVFLAENNEEIERLKTELVRVRQDVVQQRQALKDKGVEITPEMEIEMQRPLFDPHFALLEAKNDGPTILESYRSILNEIGWVVEKARAYVREGQKPQSYLDKWLAYQSEMQKRQIAAKARFE